MRGATARRSRTGARAHCVLLRVFTFLDACWVLCTQGCAGIVQGSACIRSGSFRIRSGLSGQYSRAASGEDQGSTLSVRGVGRSARRVPRCVDGRCVSALSRRRPGSTGRRFRLSLGAGRADSGLRSLTVTLCAPPACRRAALCAGAVTGERCMGGAGRALGGAPRHVAHTIRRLDITGDVHVAKKMHGEGALPTHTTHNIYILHTSCHAPRTCARCVLFYCRASSALILSTLL